MVNFRYVLIGRRANGTARRKFISSPFNLLEQHAFTADTSIEVTVPTVTQESKDVYGRYIETGINGGFNPKPEDLAMYQNYASFK